MKINKKVVKEGPENDVIFVINNGKLDDIFLDSSLSDKLDYENIKGDSFYVLPSKYYDRFVDKADSNGFIEGEDWYEVDRNGNVLESKQFKLSEIAKKILKEEILEPHPDVFGGDINLYDENERQLDTKDLIKTSKFWTIKPGWQGTYRDPESNETLKVELLGFETEGQRGRMAAFKVLSGKHKGTYIIIDALIDGKTIE